MYSTCLFCNQSLGDNEAIEHFPVGRRLAFDAAKGRLWVVCARCERWNLSPLESRWEAIEEADRAFRGTRLRTSTDNIGLARLKEGTELVRIGAPLRPEFAAWRYGDQFGRRRRKHLLFTAAAVAGAASPLLGPVLGMSIVGSFLSLGYSVTNITRHRRSTRRLVASVRDDGGTVLPLSQSNVRAAQLTARENGEWSLALPHLWPDQLGALSVKFAPGKSAEPAKIAHATLTGATALRALATILPHVNAGGGSKRVVSEALMTITSSDGPGSIARKLSVTTERSTNYFHIAKWDRMMVTMPPRLLLALEMSLHEDDERRAMEGELKELETRWREADAIAGIADSLLLPDDVDARMIRMRRAVNEEAAG